MTNDIGNSEDELPKHLIDAARSYNAPPREVPREAMWDAIQRKRAEDRTRFRWSARTWGLAAAAVVLLAVGYVAGRSEAPATVPESTTSTMGSNDAQAPTLADTIAATQHFARAEMVLTQFRNATEGKSLDTAVTRWSRQLLGDTRLLIDSPSGADPGRRRLLEQLEQILVQIARSSSQRDTEDLKLTSDALRESGLLNKLRAVVPAGTMPRG